MPRFLCLGMMCVMGLGGCATIVSGTSQRIRIQTVDAQTGSPLAVSACHITDRADNRTFLSHDQERITLKSGHSFFIRCPKVGYTQLSTEIPTSVNPWIGLNLLFWPGFMIDLMTGAYEQYPNNLQVQLEKAHH